MPAPSRSVESSPTETWFGHIETDNLVRHEWLICRQTGNPIREGYEELRIGLAHLTVKPPVAKNTPVNRPFRG